tara:strand:+ start:816 stop:1067 length:252 start_codon:yes stop_codon:yes gene_type:complete
MKLDNKISLGNVIAICTFVGSLIFAGGKLLANMETLQEKAFTALDMANKNKVSIQEIDKRLLIIETKLDDGFSDVLKALRKKK